jgi:hypothetical protein
MSEVLARCRAVASAPLRDANGSTESAQAADSFWTDLPDNLKLKEFIGRWVAYTVQGCLHVAKEHEDDQAVHRFCRASGLSPERYFVGRVVPDQGVAEVTDNWNRG